MNILQRINPLTRTEIGNIPPAQRSHRVIDLDKPIPLDPVPLVMLRDQTVKIALKDMLKPDGMFCIIDFKQMLELAGIYPPPGLMQTLRPLHCKKWRDMDPEYRNQIQQHIIACFVPIETQAEQPEEGSES